MKARPQDRADKYGDPLYSWLSVAVLGTMALGVIAAMWASYRGPRVHEEDLRMWRSWPSTKGEPSAVRVREQPMSGSIAEVRVIRTYSGECRVEYRVAEKIYSVWAEVDSDLNRQELADRMRTCPYSSFDVHYDPSDPSWAHAFFGHSIPR